ncbi:PREDICTED: heat stress transcription factor B-4b-like [Nicotiana attenuata]|uniref:heat stress transcription factor B-4b-like n=1 Tax=Nicotiana attenuata TaxID=49451 RepID=UPI000904D902|nr:PREDICTED: heat stress transcription factor B-4b-like [Nicotiana attenuata]
MSSSSEMNFTVQDCQRTIMAAPFLTKTYQLVDDQSSNHIVSWGENDTTFVVWKPLEFAKEHLPNYFKHNNFSSFVRQLNTYGFKKIVPDKWEFSNENFKKGQKHLLCEIQRRKSTPQQLHHLKPYHENITKNIFYQPKTQNNPSTDDFLLLTLTQDNQRLRKRNNLLLSELAHMKNLYNDIIYFIQNHAKPIDQKFGLFSLNEDLNLRINDHRRDRQINIEDEEPKSSSVKLFGVSLCGKKRLHHQMIDQEVLEC